MLSRACAFLAVALAAAPACLLVQPLEEVNEGDGGEAGAGSGNVAGGGRGGSGSGGKASGGAAGSSGGSGAGNPSGGNPSGGNTSSSGSGSGAEGGDDGQGGSAGSAGNAGTSGAGSGGTTGDTNYVHVWTFDGDTQGWDIGGASTADLRRDSTLIYDGGAGDPDDGSLLLTVPFTESGQTLEVAWAPAVPIDLAGKTFFARVRLEPGAGAESSGASALLFAKSGATFVWGDGGPRNLTTAQGWTTLAFDLDEDVVGQGFDPTQVVELGLNFYNAAELDAPAVFRIDTIGFDVLTRPNCIRDPLLIDDMETTDGEAWVCQTNGRAGGWWVYQDDTEGGVTSPQPDQTILLETLDPRRGDDTQALHFSASGFTKWGSGIGTNLHFGIEDQSTYYDVSAYSGVEFWARGSGNLRVQIQIPKTRSAGHLFPGTCVPTFDFGCDDNYTTPPFALTDEWQLYTVPFSSLRQRGYGMPVPFDYQLYALEFHVPENESVDLWVDDVRFLERGCLSDGINSCQAGSYSACVYGTPVSEVSCAEQCADFGAADCSGTACQCHSPTDLECYDGVEFFCACLAGTYECTPEAKVKLYQGCASGSSGRRDALLCYAQNGDDCGTSEATCWGN